MGQLAGLMSVGVTLKISSNDLNCSDISFVDTSTMLYTIRLISNCDAIFRDNC